MVDVLVDDEVDVVVDVEVDSEVVVELSRFLLSVGRLSSLALLARNLDEKSLDEHEMDFREEKSLGPCCLFQIKIKEK